MLTPPTGVAGTTGPGASAAGNGSSSAASSASALDKDAFLRLMVTQLRHQDPLNPTDSAQFLAQTAQFTSLEKLQDVADQTAQALGMQRAFGASSLVGRTVTYLGPDGVETTGQVGSVRFAAAGPLLSVGGAEVALTELVSVTS